MSADSRLLAFHSPDGNLVPLDRNRAYDIFLRDLGRATAELISARDPSLPCVTADGPSAAATSRFYRVVAY